MTGLDCNIEKGQMKVQNFHHNGGNAGRYAKDAIRKMQKIGIRVVERRILFVIIWKQAQAAGGIANIKESVGLLDTASQLRDYEIHAEITSPSFHITGGLDLTCESSKA